MRLRRLLNELELEFKDIGEKDSIMIQGIADNSSDVRKDFLFVAINGYSTNGHRFIEKAIYKGASVIVGEEDISNLSVPYIKVKNSRKALGIIAKAFYENFSKNKRIIGITGTNGKTTTSYMLKHILEVNGTSCSIIGTIQTIINGEIIQSVNTTPSSLELQKILSTSDDDVVIMEVSSHGLRQYRVEGIEFDFCLFTNLSHDHLDYHNSMDEYFSAKKSLFEKLKDNGQAIINTDDFWGEKLATLLKKEGKNLYTIGQSSNCQLKIQHFEDHMITVKEKHESSEIYSPMFGIHNMYNVVMACATAKFLNLNKEDIIASSFRFKGVEGRFEIFPMDNGTTVVIDYAHTPDAIFHCLSTAKQCGEKRIIHVFGFRGDKDPSKRQEMLSISAELSDHYILTLDDLNSISRKEMVETLEHLNKTFGNEKGIVISDRTLAVKQAIKQSIQGDWIVITGKGHEKYQQTYHLKTESDKDTVTHLLNLQIKARK